MNLPTLQDPSRYTGLYVIDFSDHCGVGFTAEEVAEVLDSEKFRNAKVYKIRNAFPDGRMELIGVRREIFELETGMFFYAEDSEKAEEDFKRLVDLAVRHAPPARAKVHLTQFSDDRFVTAMIFPAEFNEEFSQWLLDGNYQTCGAVEGGIEACQRYYRLDPRILRRHQLWNSPAIESMTGSLLLEATNRAIVR
ncbi:MAG: hypothetical protein GX455_11170 [Phycisphaerae bacterium]|nr:hypothetical protein [Phycisphaerae bacterium]